MKERGFLPQFSRADIIARAAEAGVSDTDTAAVLGIKTQSLVVWRKKHAARLARHVPSDSRPSNSVVARLLVACGVCVMDAAAVTGQTQQTVTNSRVRGSITPRYQTPANHAGMIRDFRAGMSARDVASKYGIQEASVYTLASVYGPKLTGDERRARRQCKPIVPTV